MGNEQSQTAEALPRCGYQVLKLQRNSPGERAGLMPFFDFIFEVDHKRIETDDQMFISTLEENVEKDVSLRVYNSKSNSLRETTLRPTRNWGGMGLIGISIRFCLLEGVAGNFWHVLDVYENSPASQAGLESHSDWIVGTPEVLFVSESDFLSIVKANISTPIHFIVYSSKHNSIRQITITPNPDWGGEGCLGCGVGHGLLHRIPENPEIVSDHRPFLSSPPPTSSHPASVHPITPSQPSTIAPTPSVQPSLPIPSQSSTGSSFTPTHSNSTPTSSSLSQPQKTMSPVSPSSSVQPSFPSALSSTIPSPASPATPAPSTPPPTSSSTSSSTSSASSLTSSSSSLTSSSASLTSSSSSLTSTGSTSAPSSQLNELKNKKQLLQERLERLKAQKKGEASDQPTDPPSGASSASSSTPSPASISAPSTTASSGTSTDLAKLQEEKQRKLAELKARKQNS